MPRASSPFTTIRSEGALLPPELLARIAEADKDLGGLVPTDYHLTETERLGEAIARSWNRLVGVWASFEPSLDGFNPNDPGTGATRERWLAPLFQELGFGRLQVAKAREIDGTDYAISHEWSSVPIHLVGAGVELERRTKGVAGAAKMSPHALVQDYLNRTEALWGIVSNGRELRLLRDNVSLTRQAYLTFDLEAMFSGEVYSDFALLWLTGHQSRLESQDDKVAECWLERWTLAAQTQGTRALNTLREGVEVAISALGAGFVAHPANAALREALRSGGLATTDYYRELLRLIYRLIFLFVAEDRALLHPDATAEEARSRYRDFYSMARLRRLAERLRGGPHPDLWRSFVFVCAKLASDDGCEELGLPFLGSSLFSTDACPDLDAAELANRDLLGAVRALAFTEQRGVIRQIDYRNMGSEELGSIYESLLELHPEVHHESGSFTLATAAGNERKTTGSYYTPTSLISALLDTALDPVLDEAASKSDAEAAILDLKVLDPACGSGHFLVAAAHRIAKRLAAHRTEEPEPSLAAYRAALREVISRCIFGIDVNPMAVELCKVSLWMEAVEPGKPLSFLEHHIVCGNSLLGTTPALLAAGIPHEAFTALEGDDKGTVKSLKARNKQERMGQAALFGEAAHFDGMASVAEQAAKLEQITDDSPEALHAKQQAWETLTGSDQLAHAKLIADAWCAAFVIEKTPGSPVLTQGVLQLLERNPAGGGPKLHEAIRALATRYRFLHPHLAFPQVFHTPAADEEPDNPDQGWSGGFHALVGNPPWEQIEVGDTDGFQVRREIFGVQHLTAKSGRFPLTSSARRNLYALFGEIGLSLPSSGGRMGMVLPTGIVTDQPCQALCEELVLRERVISLFDFENQGRFFASVHRQQRFCLVTAGRRGASATPDYAFSLDSPNDGADPSRVWSLAADDIQKMSPARTTVPTFTRQADVRLARAVYSDHPTLYSLIEDGRWLNTGLMFNYDKKSKAVKVRIDDSHDLDSDEWLRVYEGEFIYCFDHRFASHAGTTAHTSDDQKSDADFRARTEFVVQARDAEQRWKELAGGLPSWYLALRRQARTTDEVTSIAALVPRSAAEGSISCFFGGKSPNLMVLLCAVLNSYAFNFLVRLRQSGANLSKSVYEQVPVPTLVADTAKGSTELQDPLRWLVAATLELSYTSTDLHVLAADLGRFDAPFQWERRRREELRAALDAVVFHMYGLDASDIDYVMETFPVLRRREERETGSFVTKEMVRNAFVRLTEGGGVGSLVTPWPADSSRAHREEVRK